MHVIQSYVSELSAVYATGNATEHSYRHALKTLLESIMQGVTATNEPKRQKCGAPDYILQRKKIDIGYIEAKDIGKDLDKVERGSKDDNQFARYTKSLDNLILTDYLEFRFFLFANKTETVRVAQIENGKIIPLPNNFEKLENLLRDFGLFNGQTIRSSKKLAEMMAAKAVLMRDIFYNVVTAPEDSSLKDQLKAFQSILMHDMDAAQFADVYAQTIAYGLFTARLHDTTLADFSRSEALLLIPKSNPFLQKLFSYVAGVELDSRVVWVVDALCEVYRATDLNAILRDFGRKTGFEDPMVHFYETFLGEFDPKLRKSRGVWYTPEAVVNFIVRAVDDVLKTHFALPDGLADKSTIPIDFETTVVKNGKRVKETKLIHRVQILDVATGTGTFLAETVRQIYARFANNQGMWSSYVEQHLLPRIHGFEVLMASYAMCHMKLDLLLQETGYSPSKPENPPRVSVYLTNSLEEHHKDADTLFASWLSHEANEASRIKRDMPIMVAIGNPPYSGHSSNKGAWIENLMDVYKQSPDLKKRGQAKWLSDDYVKFIRLGEYYIEKNGEGVLAYITNHSWLDNPTFHDMRHHLMHTFDDIYVLDLHGNAKKKEKTPDGKPDNNVFDIQQGVAILIAIKKKSNAKNIQLANVYHSGLWGSREYKYDQLLNNNLKSVQYKKLDIQKPFYFFVPLDNSLMDEYKTHFGVPELFSVYGDPAPGIVSTHDQFAISDTPTEMQEKIAKFIATNTELEARALFRLCTQDQWNYTKAKQELQKNEWQNEIVKIGYRPFDERYTVYNSSVAVHRRERASKHFLAGENLGLVIGRQGAVVGSEPWNLVSISKNIIDFNIFYRGGGVGIPLYIYENLMGGVQEKRPNLEPKIYAAIKKMVPDVTPESLFDYIYAVLHAPQYRTRYAEFLKSDFPRIPYPHDAAVFYRLATIGGQIRAAHLLESAAVDVGGVTYPVDGNHTVDKLRYDDGKVYINATQYFGNVPQIAWDFFIGGYQPAQKWLKDRKNRVLSYDDITHYQRIVAALAETHRLMGEIAQIDFLPQS